jgi:starvation-inducible DNA-binding protein
MEKKVNESLNVLLADYHIFYQKLRNFHWNVKGENFFRLHEKFEEMYNEVAEMKDEIAERILSRGFTPLSKLQDYLDASRLSEADTDLKDREMVANLLGDLKGLITYQRKLVEEANEVDDIATANLLEEFADGQEKTAWMLNSFLG